MTYVLIQSSIAHLFNITATRYTTAEGQPEKTTFKRWAYLLKGSLLINAERSGT